MDKKKLLAFIDNKSLYREVGKVIDVAKKSAKDSENYLFKNVIDPFSAIFDSLFQGIGLNEWLKGEKSRQVQKTLQNALGEFHQEIIGSIMGWKSMGKGHVFDVMNEDKKIIAEVKNKYNTTKGNHKTAIYDDLKGQIKNKYGDFTAYYVEIIPRKREMYNKIFTPPDNRTGKRRPKNEKIRVIDGKSFYAMASGDADALKKIYLVLPAIIGEILGKSVSDFTKEKLFSELFDKAY